jgi:hypothetical protein
LSFFFLVPLGFAAAGYNGRTAVLAAFTAILGNIVFVLNLFLFWGQGGLELLGDLGFFSLVTVIFTWIVSPPGAVSRVLRIPGAYRLLAGSVLVFLAFLLLVLTGEGRAGFQGLLHAQAEALSSFYIAASSPDAAERSLLERHLTPEALVEAFRFIALRGGGLLSSALIFFVSRQMGRFLARVIRRREAGGSVLQFRTEPGLIWVLSGALALILLFRLAGAGRGSGGAALEIVLWNILVLCAILYLAQGWGILAFFLARAPVPPLVRLLLTALFVALLMRPGINAVILGLIVLLGIAENWVPFRAPKPNGPSSTPGM